MPLYVVIPLDKKEAVNQAVKSLPESDCFQLNGDSGWIVSYKGTSIELTKKLGLGVKNADDKLVTEGNALILALSDYYGYGPKNMWEWIRTRMGA